MSSWPDEFNMDSQNSSKRGLSPFQHLPLGNEIDVGSVAPIFGIAGSNDADYLDYNVKGRSYSERMLYNSGTSYLLGISAGGFFGAIEGLRTSPSRKPKILLNSVLNVCGKRGSKTGNALGVLAMFYSSFEALADNTELDRYIPVYDQVIPIVAASASGILYKSTAGPRPMILAGLLGAGLMASAQAGIAALDIRF